MDPQVTEIQTMDVSIHMKKVQVEQGRQQQEQSMEFMICQVVLGNI